MDKKRLSLDIPLLIHQRIKIAAAKRNISMLLWIMRAIVEKLAQEEKYE